MDSNNSRLDQLNELPLTKEDQRFILRCLREGGVVDYQPVLAAYQLCWNNAAESATIRKEITVGGGQPTPFSGRPWVLKHLTIRGK